MDLVSQILFYLDKRHYMLDMKVQCEDFLSSLNTNTISQFPPFRYLFELDVMDLSDIFPDLGAMLLKEPFKFQQNCNKILYACIKSMQDYEFADTIRFGQIAVTIRLKNVSQLMVRIYSRTYRGLAGCEGILIDISKPVPYVYHSVWCCPEDCDGNEVILQCIPKVPPKCYVCRSSLYENSGLRRCGEQVTVVVKSKSDNMFCKSYKVVDDLISKVKIGSKYLIIVVIMKKTIEVWSIEPIIPISAPISTPLSSDIKELFLACDGLPWKFIYCLASTIGASICPLNCFMDLKISILLSATSVRAHLYTESRIIHVLAAGSDTGVVNAIMHEGAKLANPSLTLGTSNTSVQTALIATSGGICLLPLPLHCYSSKIISRVLSSIETREVQYATGRTILRTAVWAHGMDFKKLTVHNVASIFGTICRGDVGEYEDEISEFLLQKALNVSETCRDEKRAIAEIVKYIDLVAGLKVDLDVCAEKLLKNYFLAARRDKPRGVTVGSMESLVATCLTSARLCRRNTANTEDATFAIWLNVIGSSEPRIAPSEYLITPADINKLHETFDSFKKWLQDFITTYGY